MQKNKIMNSTTIAEYYLDELIDWNDSINFYIGEIAVFEQKLVEIIRRNTITDIAKKVEVELAKFIALLEKFNRLQINIQKQNAALQTDEELIENLSISIETEKLENELRNKMKALEKEYIDVKFDCYNFLSGTLKK
jgi:hypothetical protein